jgi:hypothetical protein
MRQHVHGKIAICGERNSAGTPEGVPAVVEFREQIKSPD